MHRNNFTIVRMPGYRFDADAWIPVEDERYTAYVAISTIGTSGIIVGTLSVCIENARCELFSAHVRRPWRRAGVTTSLFSAMYARERPVAVDVEVISDLGLTTANRLAARWPHIPWTITPDGYRPLRDLSERH